MDKVVVENVNFKYEDKFIFNKNLNFNLEKNKIYLLKGNNGSGKSSFINLILKLWTKYDGDIFFDNINLREISREKLTDYIGITFQNTAIFNDSIRENICVGRNGNVDKIIKLFSFDKDIECMGRTLDTIIESKENLSSGQIQKIGILRNIFENKHIYIFDEATANLDISSKKQFNNLIKYLKKDRIIIIISHEKDTIKHVDEVINF